MARCRTATGVPAHANDARLDFEPRRRTHDMARWRDSRAGCTVRLPAESGRTASSVPFEPRTRAASRATFNGRAAAYLREMLAPDTFDPEADPQPRQGGGGTGSNASLIRRLLWLR